MSESLANLPDFPPSLYLDCEGKKLGRHGSVTSLTLYVRPIEAAFIIDIHVLGNAAFDTPFHNGRSLREILEDRNIPKCFWDVRRDSDALFKHHQVCLQGIIDVQLMENLSRPRRDPTRWKRNRLMGYGDAIVLDAGLSPEVLEIFREMKDFGKRTLQDEDWEMLHRRPMDKDIQFYCASDTDPMARLYELYRPALTDEEYQEVLRQSVLRVDESFWSDEKLEKEKKLAWNEPWSAPAEWQRDELQMEMEMEEKEKRDWWPREWARELKKEDEQRETERRQRLEEKKNRKKASKAEQEMLKATNRDGIDEFYEKNGDGKNILKDENANLSEINSIPERDGDRHIVTCEMDAALTMPSRVMLKTGHLEKELSVRDLEISRLKKQNQKVIKDASALRANNFELERLVSSNRNSHMRNVAEKRILPTANTMEMKGVAEWLRKHNSAVFESPKRRQSRRYPK